ncbi:Uma2 family endonuclease [Kamptonema formosum]|uniref:Uma2 family endonuclease n=1 Tax=Kamptonema formosum TaxID=331992 RepID=UPI0003794F4C|nr:Uma2 family endonuclease [Oscillatoria sp. PCC 10802]
MIYQLQSPSATNIIYPESDGQPMADNTRQFRWIMILYYNLEWLFAGDSMVFVAGDLLWYPVEGDNTIRQAPDVMVVFGVPKGDRGSYMQWREGNIAPQVVFEILSPGNTQTEMNKKLRFYNRYGVEEYYLYDPQKNDLSGWLRSQADLEVIEPVDNWVSPRLGIRFDLSGEELQIYRPNGERFASYVEIHRQLEEQQQRATDAEQRAEQEQQRAEQERQRAEQERQRAEQERQRAEQERQRAERLAERLRAAGIEPE